MKFEPGDRVKTLKSECPFTGEVLSKFYAEDGDIAYVIKRDDDGSLCSMHEVLLQLEKTHYGATGKE